MASLKEKSEAKKQTNPDLSAAPAGTLYYYPICRSSLLGLITTRTGMRQEKKKRKMMKMAIAFECIV